jgi:hypothetical protein
MHSIEATSLHALLISLPLGYFLLGDNAYKPSEHIVPIFGGANRINVDCDNCNYYMSQRQIRGAENGIRNDGKQVWPTPKSPMSKDSPRWSPDAMHCQAP